MAAKKEKSAPPKLHKFMHPRNPYRTLPSFKELAQKYPGFRAHCMYDIDGKVRLNFKDPLAVRELTTCLLDQDFDLKVEIPKGRLVPTLPLRLNYILWIEDLLNLSGCRSIQKDFIVGLDVGCGASCIYPLLAAKQNGWYMMATEADSLSFDHAVSNINKNNLETKIVVRKVEQDVILKGVLDNEKIACDALKFRDQRQKTEVESTVGSQAAVSEVGNPKIGDGYLLDFMMCNPPFFGSIEETDSMNKTKRVRGEPRSAPTGSIQETVTEGGEVAFICKMIEESFLLKEKVRIFSSMIGTKSHVKEVKDKLKSVNPAHFSIVEFCQGRTMRWGIAWTFNPSMHLENVMSKKQMDSAKPLVLMLPRSQMTVYTVPAAWAMVNKWLHQLKVSVQIFKKTKYFVGANVKAYKTTWLNQRRKRREQKRKEGREKEKNKPSESEKAVVDTSTEIENDNEVIGNTELEAEDEISLKRPHEEDSEEEENYDGLKKQKTQNLEDIINRGMKMKGNQPVEDSCNSLASDVKPKEENSDGEELDDKFRKKIEIQTETNGNQSNSGGLECILKAKFQLKQCGALISLEALYLRGSAGKDGLNQIFQFMRNQLTKH